MPAIRIHGRTVEMIPLADLKPYGRNARKHPEDQLQALEAIIRDSGFTTPLIIDPKGNLIAGHGRAIVAQRLGLESVPCIRVKGLNPAQIRALRLSDNQIAARSDWDNELLLGELKDLLAADFDLGLTGFRDDELGELGVPGFTLEERLEEAEETPPLPAKPVVRPGELWLLGDHRVLCGDSTKAEDVARLLGATKPHLMVTDPPYGVEYDPDWRNRADRANGKPYGARAIGKVVNDDRADWTEAFTLFRGDVVYCWHPPGANSVVFYHSLETAGFDVRMQIIWAKQQFPIGRGNYHVKHEPCWYAVRKGGTAHWAGDRKQTTLWEIDKPQKSETGHGTQKPIECMRRPILNNSKPDDSIYEPFCGSGTTLIACEMEQRRCFAIEIDPAYVEVIIQRWQSFTGKTAKREDGTTLADLLAAKPKAA